MTHIVYYLDILFRHFGGLEKGLWGGDNWSDNLVIFVDFGDDKRPDIFWQCVISLDFTLFSCNLDGDGNIASIGLPIKLIGNGVETRILASMMLPVMLEGLVARFQRLL